jgi:uncharacterized protein YecE (DUF72 family)
MIEIGLAGWGDHHELYTADVKPRDRLQAYSEHFSIVEVDSSFYAIQPEANYQRWVEMTPGHFGFIIKAYQGMTGHQRGTPAYPDASAMFRAFLDSIRPALEAGKLRAVLFQYPPWFDCNRRNVETLRRAKAWMGDIPAALEFRHQSWFLPEVRHKTLEFMKQEGWIHSICDEPQAGPGSVPTVLEPTDPTQTIVRMHGRNASGWAGGGTANWRDVRYLYQYSLEELAEWKGWLDQLSARTERICMIFNNNSGGDAAANAKQMMELLGMKPAALAPKQLEWFDDGGQLS